MRADEKERRRRWAYGLIRKAKSPPPTYGSPEWLALPDGSDDKIAAVVIAAECWAVDGDDIANRLALELENHMIANQRMDEDLHNENVKMVQRLATRPGIGKSYAERRAEELENAVKPRPGDFPGRGHLRRLSGGDAA